MRISVVGSANMDMNILSERIPLKGETVKGTDIEYRFGGKGANQAVAMAKLGAEVVFYGCVGDDENGLKTIENLKKERIDINNLKIISNVPTGIAIITVGENDNTIVVVPGANDYVTKEYVDSVKKDLLESDLIVLQNEIPFETIEYLINICYENGVKVLLNPAPALKVKENLLEKITYLTPNEHETKLIFGENIDIEEILKVYPNKLIITLGEEGVAFAKDKDTIIHISGRKTKVVDTTGAGDTLNGAFAFKVIENGNIEEALKFANVAASISTEKLGAQTGMPTLKKVLENL
ncbi:ribokinase [Miniphocaeibacter massiliensis]|uniref:ribokinase n=1 Tax=Miniphocaeibacter massiliensis TaxID=2041841 RepID=UPI000C1BC9A3|nr:ribokinase [Miniphocaeibacter massiliensis]